MEDRRQHIIDKAKTIFSEKGFSGTGLREIAEKAGVSTGNIYNYFKNKEEIFNACLNPATLLDSFPDFSSLIDAKFPESLDTIILTMNQVVEQNIEEYRLLFIDLIELGGTNTNLLLQSLLDYGKIIFDQRVKDSFVGQSIRSLDYDFFNRVFVISTVSYFLISKILPAAKDDRYNDKEAARLLADVIIRGVGA